jgi:hypothetical protein
MNIKDYYPIYPWLFQGKTLPADDSQNQCSGYPHGYPQPPWKPGAGPPGCAWKKNFRDTPRDLMVAENSSGR